MPRRRAALSDTAIRPSVCPSLGYWHAGCLQLAGMCELRTRPRTDVQDGLKNGATDSSL